jgi:hypothetical protein
MALAGPDDPTRRPAPVATKPKPAPQPAPSPSPAGSPQTPRAQPTADDNVIRVARGQRLTPSDRTLGYTNSAAPLTTSAITQSSSTPHGWTTPRTADYRMFRASIESDYAAQGGPSDAVPATSPPIPPNTDPSTAAARSIPPDRKAKIDQWNKDLANKNYEEYGGAPQDAMAVADALRGKSSLGPLSDAEKRYVIDTNMDRWLDVGHQNDPYNRSVNYIALSTLAHQAAGDRSISQAVSNAYADRAIAISNAEARGKFPNEQQQAAAASVAADAIWASGRPGSQDQRNFIERMGPDNIRSLTTALNLTPANLLDGGSAALGRATPQAERVALADSLLKASTLGPPTAASNAFVDAAFASAGNNAYSIDPALGKSMGQAIAKAWHPNDPTKSASEGTRLGDILSTDQGRQLLTNDNLTLSQRLANLDLVKSKPDWNAKFLSQKGSVYDIPAVSLALAAPTARQYESMRGDTPQTLTGTNLDNTVGFAMGLPPGNIPANESPAQQAARERAVAKGNYSYYSGDPANKYVKPVVDAIRSVGGSNARVTVLPVQFASPNTGPVQLPLFRVQDKATGQDKFVDNEGRIYSSFEDWKNNNKLPAGNMTYPANGHLSSKVELETKDTPATPDTAWKKIKNGLNDAALVGGTIAGGAIILGSDGILAPVVLGAASAWTTYQSISALNDRADHGQSINPLTDPGARAAWLAIGANGLNLATLGATGLAGRAVEAGSDLALPAATAASWLRVGTSTLDTAAAANAGYTLWANWSKLSAGDRAQLALSAGFWGVSTFAGGRLSGTSPTEAFNAGAVRDQIVYGGLDPNVRSAIQDEIAKGTGTTSDTALSQLAVNRQFRSLPPDQQIRLLKGYGALSSENRTAFDEAMGRLDDAGRSAFINEFRSSTNGTEGQDSLLKLVSNGSFSKLSPETQREVIDGWKNNTPWLRDQFVTQIGKQTQPGDAQILGQLWTSRGYQSMTVGQRARLLEYVGGSNLQISWFARRALGNVFQDPKFAGLTPEEQQAWYASRSAGEPISGPSFDKLTPDQQEAALKEFMQNQPGIPNVVANFPGSFRTAKYQLSAGTPVSDVPFASGAAAGTRYQVTVDGRAIDVYLPSNPKDVTSIDTVAEGLAKLPADARSKIKTLYVDAKSNPHDAILGGIYGIKDYQAAATVDPATGNVNLFPLSKVDTPDMLAGTLTHESGHIIASEVFGHDGSKGWTEWENAVRSDGLEVSTYAKTTPGEDFSETYQLYQMVKGTPSEAEFRAMYPNRFRILDQITKGKTP